MTTEPVCTVGAIPMTRDELSSPVHHVFRYVPRGTEGPGAKTVSVALEDAAGNSTTTALGVVAFDFEAPPLRPEDVTVSPGPLVGLGANLVVTATAGEALQDAALASTPGLELGSALISGRSAIWSHVVLASDDEGPRDLEFVVSDAAGNTTTFAKTAAFSLDTSVPAVLPGFALGPSPAKDGTVVVAEFDVSEPTGVGPIVLMGGVPMEKVADRSNSTHFVFVHAAGVAEGQGPRTVTVALRDDAGNRSTTPVGSVVYDFEAPALTPDDILVSPAPPIGLAANLRVSVTAAEPLAAAVLETQPRVAMGEAVIAARTAIWSHVVAASDPGGPVDVTVTVEDLAGNRISVSRIAAAVLDTSAPSVALATVGPRRCATERRSRPRSTCRRHRPACPGCPSGRRRWSPTRPRRRRISSSRMPRPRPKARDRRSSWRGFRTRRETQPPRLWAPWSTTSTRPGFPRPT